MILYDFYKKPIQSYRYDPIALIDSYDFYKKPIQSYRYDPIGCVENL